MIRVNDGTKTLQGTTIVVSGLTLSESADGFITLTASSSGITIGEGDARYLKLDGTNSMSATTLIGNLNADLLDGQHGAFYQNAGNLNAGTLLAARFAANTIAHSALANSAAAGLSVLGRSANSAGAFAEIAAGTDGHVLRRAGTGLGFGTLASGAFAANTIAHSALANSAAAGLSVLGRNTNSAGAFAEIAAASDGQVLRRSGTSLQFGAVDLGSANAVAGTLPVSRAGTGVANPTAGNLLVGNGTSAMTLLAPGTVGGYIRSDGTTWVRVSGLAAADLTGTINTAQLSGAYTNITAVGNLTGLTVSGDALFQSTAPRLRINDADGTTNQRIIDLAYNTDRLDFEARADAGTLTRIAASISHAGVIEAFAGYTVGGTTVISSTRVLSNITGNITMFDAGTLSVTRGGTGVSNPTSGNLLVGAGASAMTLLAPGAAAGYVRSNGSAWVRNSGIPADDISGAVRPDRGGTGLTSWTAGNLLVGSSASTSAELAFGAAGGYVRSNGSAWVRNSGVPAADVQAGTFPSGTFTFSGILVLANRLDQLTANTGSFIGGSAPVALANTGSGYPGVGYNFKPDGAGSWLYRATDFAMMMQMEPVSGLAAFRFHTSASGTANTAPSFSERFRIAHSYVYSPGDFIIGNASLLRLDGSTTGDTWIDEVSADQVRFVTGGVERFRLEPGVWTTASWTKGPRVANGTAIRWFGSPGTWGIGASGGSLYHIYSTANDAADAAVYWMTVDGSTRNVVFSNTVTAQDFVLA